MGQSKGYKKVSTVSPEQNTFIQQMLAQALPNLQQAAEGYKQFLPGGGGGQPFVNQANRNFQQQTIPSILNAFGRDSKGSSALNQALAAGGANLNTDLASTLAQLQLQASHGLSGQAQAGGQQGLTPTFALQQRQQPFWQSLLLGGLNTGAQLGRAYLGGGLGG